jgi:hypothetical protein
MAQSGVIQRVTYKGVLYDPAKEDEQTKFFAEAKKDMMAAGMWKPGRTEKNIKAIGITERVIENVAGLDLAERKYWKEYDEAIDADLVEVVVPVQRAINDEIAKLERDIPRLKTDNLSVQVTAAVAEIKRLFGTLPGKWRLDAYGTDKFQIPIRQLLACKPWTLAAKIAQKREALAAELASQQPAAPPVPVSASSAPAQGPPVPVAPSKKETRLRQALQELAADEVAAARLEKEALESVGTMKLLQRQIEEQVRLVGASHYKKGLTGYVTAKSKMNKKKFYLGEVATTEPLTKTKKALGVLWAKPWSPGVNVAFLEGGVEAGAVYKLKTAVPDNLKASLVGGNHAAFRAAVDSQASDPYRPFWHGEQKRFTIYTEELTFLVRKGYRLQEFKRKDGSMQQLLVHPDQLAEVTAAYDGR